jgi:hypothetical protein
LKLKKDNDELITKIQSNEKILSDKEKTIEEYKIKNTDLFHLADVSLEGIIIHDRGFPILFNRAVS